MMQAVYIMTKSIEDSGI